MADQFVAEVRCVGFNFAPKGWALCDGQILSLSQNTALFSLLGTFYGGNGQSNFGLPNLQGNVAISQGDGAGLTPRVIGEQGGESAVTLLQTEMTQHNHIYKDNTVNGPGNVGTPGGTTTISSGVQMFTTATTPLVAMAANSIGINGNGQPHNNMMPYLTLNFVIALQGIYPARA